MKLTMLGTGHALVTKCYNTCFIITEEMGKTAGEEQCFLVDAGGGNMILTRLEQAGIDWRSVRDIFVTHNHVDHVVGMIWMLRIFCQSMSHGTFDEEVRIYAHAELIGVIRQMALLLLQEKEAKFIDDKVLLIPVEDGEEKEILGHRVRFFDIGSTNRKQFGFTMDLNETGRLTCLGDEPYHACTEQYVKGSTWLMHEAFCMYAEREIFDPYPKHHSTVMDACRLAEMMKVKNLILYHTEDTHIEDRKQLYYSEGAEYYSGNLFVPDDLDEINL